MRTLARVHRWQLDQLRQQAAELQGLRDNLLRRDEDLAASLRREAEIAAQIDGGAGFGLYAQQIRMQRDSVSRSLCEVEEKLGEKQDEIAEIYQEVKRYETLADRMRERRRQAEAQREQAELDEVGLNAHRLRHVEDAA